MRFPAIHGIIDRRILVNYRVDPAVLAPLLPAPFRVKLVNGWAVAGICLIRLKHIRPRLAPAALGLASENAAHRIAVEWLDGGSMQPGVYVPRRDTSSRWNAWAGDRIFPGVHHHARFQVDESGGCYHVNVASDDGQTQLAVDARAATALPVDSIFGSLKEASSFFEAGSLGYSPNRGQRHFDGIELHCRDWSVRPLAVDRLESSWFQDLARFPLGSVKLDCALLMTNITHQWLARAAIGAC